MGVDSDESEKYEPSRNVLIWPGGGGRIYVIYSGRIITSQIFRFNDNLSEDYIKLQK